MFLPTLITSLIDRLPRLRRLAASEYGRRTVRCIELLFPERSAAEHSAIMRAFLRHRAINRGMYYLTTRAPAIAALLSHCVPLANREHLDQANLHDGPVIVTTAHVGSLVFQLLALTRALRGRQLYVMHRRLAADAPRDHAFMTRRGMTPVGADSQGLRTLVKALENSRRIAILVAFDAPIDRRHVLPFLSTTVLAAAGVGFLAEIGKGPVVPYFWRWERWRPSMAFGEPIFADQSLPRGAQRLALVKHLYRLLEARTARYPEQWHLYFIDDSPARTPTPMVPAP